MPYQTAPPSALASAYFPLSYIHFYKIPHYNTLQPLCFHPVHCPEYYLSQSYPCWHNLLPCHIHHSYTESHKKAIDRYDKDFNNTEKNVHNKADSNSKKAYAFAIPAVVIALLLIAFIGIALTGSVKKAVKKSAITNNYTEISNKIYSYLDSSSYKELSDYSDEIDALDNKAFDKEYSVLMGVRYYVWSVGFMNTNDSDNYNLTQSDVSNLPYSSFLYRFINQRVLYVLFSSL
jgi:hypothetical protein